MPIRLLLNGRTEVPYVQAGIEDFEKRIRRYTSYESVVIPSLKNTKNMPIETQKKLEADAVFRLLQEGDFVVLLDEHGVEYSSKGFADQLQQWFNRGPKNLVFIVGGPYGFAPELHQRSQAKVSLSQMTFSHQLIRLIFCEQLYRGFTILKGDPYHNE